MTNEELDRWIQDQAVLTKLKLQEIIEARVMEEREKIYSAIEDYFISSYPIPDANMLCGYIREALTEIYMTTKI